MVFLIPTWYIPFSLRSSVKQQTINSFSGQPPRSFQKVEPPFLDSNTSLNPPTTLNETLMVPCLVVLKPEFSVIGGCWPMLKIMKCLGRAVLLDPPRSAGHWRHGRCPKTSPWSPEQPFSMDISNSPQKPCRTPPSTSKWANYNQSKS